MIGALVLAAFFVVGSGFAALQPLDLQQKIDRAAALGGGVVTVKPGEWEVRPIVLKSHITLRLKKGATLFARTGIAHDSRQPSAQAFI